ncbi:MULTISPECIES: restriction endonuclease fold toxin 5 domain-containing protein [unclassified Corallococcus]|uniref:restriction endonuclease fold toxin 5 domain-containing protein n=1 Tax=unclassified Corallococcus TaxID=2685029 RepID=UPI001A8F216E|nr:MULTISPECIES: restriction endonuclease fold toxin 5 domain-containing protein [unclassified Corallococcus]MBN9681454.1 restriction endonuclease fold toxin 5 domain-containing protein [Corallococcus sp. NCSPR001]WAS86968.1 restriction endonuclease fold toxin 5 domain-containing protein [Corallococcus sp. NCRR]
MRAHKAGVWMVLFVLLTGCASGPTVRLRTERGTRTFAPVTRDRRVPVSAREFEEALARLVLEVPLTVRAPKVVRAVAKKGAQLDLGLGFMLRDGYGRWCRAHEASGDCLSLLEDGAGFGELDRLTLAVGMSLDPLRASIGAALQDTLNPEFFVSVVSGAIASWVVLAAAPEPVFTKAAAVIAAVFLAYVGVQSFLAVVRACGALKDATDRAKTFQELEEAAEVFAQALGPEVARVFVLAVTVLVSHGVTMGLSSSLALMPRFPDAVRAGAANVGFNPARVLDVSAVAVVDGVVEVTLASTAVAMAVKGPPPPSNSTGGPGKWVQVNESMSDRARDYQAQVTGAPKGSAYRLKVGDEEVDFDGYDLADDLLLEAKGPGYAKFIKDDMSLEEFYRGFVKVLDQARRQSRLAQGKRIRWIVAEERFATFLRNAFELNGIRIDVVTISPIR